MRFHQLGSLLEVLFDVGHIAVLVKVLLTGPFLDEGNHSGIIDAFVQFIPATTLLFVGRGHQAMERLDKIVFLFPGLAVNCATQTSSFSAFLGILVLLDSVLRIPKLDTILNSTADSLLRPGNNQ